MFMQTFEFLDEIVDERWVSGIYFDSLLTLHSHIGNNGAVLCMVDEIEKWKHSSDEGHCLLRGAGCRIG